jgi:Flp pilus assembly protein TadG
MEFALVFPLVVSLLFGVIDGGRLVIDRYMVSYAAVVGGRVASVRSTSTVTAVQTAVIAAVPFLGLASSAVTVAANGVIKDDTNFGAHATGFPNTVTVTVTYNYKAFWIPFFRGTKVIRGTSQVIAE